jgi:hypothetical protein
MVKLLYYNQLIHIISAAYVAHHVLALDGKRENKKKRKMLAALSSFFICRREQKSMHPD